MVERGEFQDIILSAYRDRPRPMPWRETKDPYAILVSEFMLQQTQVARVLPKYLAWLAELNCFDAVAQAPLQGLMRLWSGLGYNRRCLWLRETCRRVATDYQGRLPEEPGLLAQLPGLGPYTSKAVATFAFGKPCAFMETNIRRVYLHFYFSGRPRASVPDSEILPLVETTLFRDDPRSWYYALMDYGAELGRGAAENANTLSKAYRRQAPFRGSLRQARGYLLRRAALDSPMGLKDVAAESGIEYERLDAAAQALVREGLLVLGDKGYGLAD